MEDWLKPANITAMTQLVLPGFVITYVRARILPVRRVELKDAILGYIVISFFYQALLSPFATWISPSRSPSVDQALISILVSLALPALLGLLLGMDAQKNWTRRVFRRVGINLSHPIDAAWDWRLGQEECWVHVSLKDGTKWAGHLGPDSFSSTDPTERDLYIDDVYETGVDDKNWTKRGSGVWIAHGEIQTIEFWPEHRDTPIEQPSNDGMAVEPEAVGKTIELKVKLEGVAIVETPKQE